MHPRRLDAKMLESYQELRSIPAIPDLGKAASRDTVRRYDVGKTERVLHPNCARSGVELWTLEIGPCTDGRSVTSTFVIMIGASFRCSTLGK